MNAIDLLESQHREVEDLFEQIDDSDDADVKADLFQQIADKLAVHAAIEEHHFYPTVKANQTVDILRESVEEHLAIKRLIADLLETDVENEGFDAKVKVLQETVGHHVDEEEGDLFPKVHRLLDKEQLEALGQEMSAEQAELEDEGAPHDAIPSETDHAAPI